MAQGEDEYVRRVQEQANNYDRTIQALVCLDSAIRYHGDGYLPGSEFLPAQALHTSAANRISPDTDVRPDLVIQIDPTYGIVGEVKITASTDKDFHRAAEQIAKYDDNLSGWPTPDRMIATHDLCLLVGVKHVKEAKAYFDAAPPYTRLFVLLNGSQDFMRELTWVFERRSGRFSDNAIDGKFASNVAVAVEPVLGGFGGAKFLDSHPGCVEWTMDVLWTCHFPGCPAERLPATRSTPAGEVRRVATVKTATEELRRNFALTRPDTEGQPTSPLADWVRKAMDAFVSIGRASRARDRPGVYLVRYPARRGKAGIAAFARQLYRAQRRGRPGRPARDARQLTLLDEEQ